MTLTSPTLALKNQKGVAILIAMFAMTLMMFIATEISYDTNVDYIVARQQMNRLKSYYAARAGVEISLLRVLLYKRLVATFGKQLGQNLNMIDPVWNIPFMWPPSLPDEASSFAKDSLQETVQSSTMDSQFVATIQSEGGKIDINDLGSESKALRDATKMQILKIFQSEVQNNETFSQDFRDARFEELVNNMIDWVDPDTESLNGGGEKDPYRDEFQSEMIPPNQPFKTMEELNMVAGMNDEFFKLLKSRVTIFGTKGININYAPKEVLFSLDPSMNEEAVTAIIKRRSDPAEGGPFANDQDFLGFIQRFNVNVQAIQRSGIPLIYGAEFNFRIQSIGTYGNTKREITAVTFDLENLTDRYLEILDKEAKQAQGGPGANNPAQDPNAANPPSTPPPPTEKTLKIPQGRPTVVYWHEDG